LLLREEKLPVVLSRRAVRLPRRLDAKVDWPAEGLHRDEYGYDYYVIWRTGNTEGLCRLL